MALIVEDGTGKADAESYCTVAFADAHFAARNVPSWDGSDAHREGLLRLATDYMLAQYKWAGERVTSTQALDWPRTGVVAHGFELATNVVPIAVQRACAELAHRANHSTLMPDLGKTTVREKVDVIEVEYSQQPGARESTSFAAVNNMLAPYLVSYGANRPLVRT